MIMPWSTWDLILQWPRRKNAEKYLFAQPWSSRLWSACLAIRRISKVKTDLTNCSARTIRNRRTPQPKANLTQEKTSLQSGIWNIGSKWHLGHFWHLGQFFPQQIIFRGLRLVLYRKQTRNLTHPILR